MSSLIYGLLRFNPQNNTEFNPQTIEMIHKNAKSEDIYFPEADYIEWISQMICQESILTSKFFQGKTLAKIAIVGDLEVNRNGEGEEMMYDHYVSANQVKEISEYLNSLPARQIMLNLDPQYTENPLGIYSRLGISSNYFDVLMSEYKNFRDFYKTSAEKDQEILIGSHWSWKDK